MEAIVTVATGAGLGLGLSLGIVFGIWVVGGILHALAWRASRRKR